MLETLKDKLPAAAALQDTIANLDACFLHGFVGGQYEILAALPQIFAGAPLQARIEECVQSLAQNNFNESHFVTLAAVRGALQGALYDALRQQALSALGRAASDPVPEIPTLPTQTDPLLDSARHWLMELAMTGFARLEPGTIASFAPTLAQLRANPATTQQAALLTGLLHELMNALPAPSIDRIPLLRWCDLWSNAMLGAVGIADAPEAIPVSGIFYPLGVELRGHTRMASMTVHGLLLVDDEPRWVRQSWSAFKATAIQGDEIWLLFPEAQMLLGHLLQNKTIRLQDMPMLPSGDLLWNIDRVESGKKFKPLNITLEYAGIGQPLAASPVPALERHPVQLAEPLSLTEYRLENDCLHFNDGTVLPLDTRRNGLTAESLEATTTLFGLLRYDDGAWSVQPLTAGNAIGKFEFVGQAGAELLKKPPKTNTVSILQERASRLLRKSKASQSS
ncbi:MAG: hypothetical protein ABI690_26925 [Chloroflexota bacterium]